MIVAILCIDKQRDVVSLWRIPRPQLGARMDSPKHASWFCPITLTELEQFINLSTTSLQTNSQWHKHCGIAFYQRLVFFYGCCRVIGCFL